MRTDRFVSPLQLSAEGVRGGIVPPFFFVNLWFLCYLRISTSHPRAAERFKRRSRTEGLFVLFFSFLV